MKFSARAGAAALAGLICAQAQAASVYLTPATAASGTPSTLEFALYMDFAAGEATIGGGIDVDLVGALDKLHFTPSSYFTAAADPAFTGHGTALADNDYEIHFGHFNGLSGNNLLGTLTVDFAATGPARIDLAANSFFGGFYSIAGAAMDVPMHGAVIDVPEPASVALWLLGGFALAARLRRPSAMRL